jgi:uncharacterized membrane protein YkvA (DUF1232 family)
MVRCKRAHAGTGEGAAAASTVSTVDVVQAALITIAVIVGLWAIVVVVVWLAAPSQASALDLVRLLPDLLRMTAGLARDPATPRSCKVALGGLAVWLASPIDLIPEFIPVIGPLDDIVVTAIVLRWVGRRVGVEALRAHWPGSDDGFGLVLRLLGRTPA